jgi:hypothetical protein
MKNAFIPKETLGNQLIIPNYSLSDISEIGELDSDGDKEIRRNNMRDPEMREFNMNDILGNFDTDRAGNIRILKDKYGDWVDKKGLKVNSQGYLIDSVTGDILEKEQRMKIFDSKDISRKGELPPPFNLERLNFNGHSVRGFFKKDDKGRPKTNNGGILTDSLGRQVNEQGFLIDEAGNIVGERGRIKLCKEMLSATDGAMPSLLNYNGDAI